MEKMKDDILKYGKHSQYWEEYVNGLPWDNDSAETKFYVAGVLNGFPHDFVLEKMVEQTKLHDDFCNMGFFMWTDYFKKLSQDKSQQPNLNQINITGNVVDSTIIIGNKNEVQK